MSEAPQTLDRGTYELLRERLLGHGRELSARVEKLNASRKQTFGGVEPELVATERVATEHNCIPRDIAAVGETLLFGFNVHFGLKAERSPADVFAAFAFSERRFQSRPLTLLDDAAFQKDFKDVYRFYKDASFEKFVSRGPLLYMQLRTGPGEADIKTFKWATQGESLQYVDNRSDHELRLPPQHEFDWQRPRREDHVHGKHPHVNIADKVFVETIGGDLTIKVENNTDTGEGIYEEPVDNADQTLDDAEIRFAVLESLLVLRVKPYQENTDRHIVYCEKTRQAIRLDGIARCCRLLPADQGLIYPSGFLLHTGNRKSFDGVPKHAQFEQRIDAPNGEDFLYIFYDRTEGLYVLTRYNIISQTTDPPLLCHGYTLFAGGELVCFRAQHDPQRHHAVQIWRTPFTAEAQLPEADASSDVFKIGNREIVRGLSECREILTLLEKEDNLGDLYAEIAGRAGDLLDSYYWIRSPATFRLDESLEQIRSAALSAIEEHAKVARARETAKQSTAELQKRIAEATATAGRRTFESVAEFTETLALLRTLRGETIGLREIRYTEPATIDALEATLAAESEQVATRCIVFLDRPDALDSFATALAEERSRLDAIKTVRDAKDADERVTKVAGDLELLIETVSNLPIDDATQRTRVVDAVSAVFATVNALRAEIRNRRKSLARTEGAAEFGSQLKLLSQAVVNALDRCDTPERCDEQFSKLLLQVEELEGRFAEFDEFTVPLAEKREEIASAFETRKTSLLEARAKRSGSLAAAADRLLGGIGSRARTLSSADEIQGYFASDLTVAKVRDLAGQLSSLGDAVRADGLLTRLKALRDDAVRQLKDRQDLFAEGPGIINLGGFRFGVNTQPVDLTTVVRDEQLHLHLTGTRFFEVVDDAELLATRHCWDQDYASETTGVYRGEYLAYSLFTEAVSHGTLKAIAKLDEKKLAAWVAEQMAPRYTEGYLKGVHDHDAAVILKTLIKVHEALGPLRTAPSVRALARLFWRWGCSERNKAALTQRLTALRELAAVWPDRIDDSALRNDLTAAVTGFAAAISHFKEVTAASAASFLTERLLAGDSLPVSGRSAELAAAFHRDLAGRNAAARFEKAQKTAGEDAATRYEIARNWLAAFVDPKDAEAVASVEEAAVLLLGDDATEPIAAKSARDLKGLLGEHPLIQSGRLHFDYHEFTARLQHHVTTVVPRFRTYVDRKHAVITEAREELRLEELKPRVMASFVRNRLIDTAYLPLIGANLAKQIGVAGEETRADRQGMLLLISPPGYGKTTLMEYVAERLGLVFLKINGPAIGHAVTSLDPAAAPNLAAREELKKLGLAFEMGDNAMIYVDDIQHCHPEFLQKFISLCDAQRKVEGVWRGEAKTYDLRGRKVAVVMAGNPYTESGDKFQIPDMLANRADVYNLGDVTGRHREAFELSFVENSLTSNAVLSRLAARPQDVVGVARLAQDKDPSAVSFEGNYPADELQAMVAVMRKLLRVRDVVLAVNAEYIRSAAQADEFRVAPPFKLQGSYRNMNRIAERVLPAMNDAELDELIWSSYRNDAQTLTTGAEANLLRFRELAGWLTDDESRRWNEIKQTFCKNQSLRGVDQSDRFGQAIAQLALFVDGLADLRETLSGGIERIAEHSMSSHQNNGAAFVEPLKQVQQTLERLGASIQGNFSRLADREPIPAEERHLTLDPTLVRQLLDSLQSAGAAVQDAEGDVDAVRGRAGTVTIVNKIPVTLLNVLQEQFRLMETWLRPVHTASQRQSADYEALATQIRACLANYQQLVGRIEASRGDGEA